MLRKGMRAAVLLVLTVGPLVLGGILHEGSEVRAASGECWRIDLQQCVSCGACVGMFDWMFAEGEDGKAQFISPNECGIVSGMHNEVIQVVDPDCINLMHEIDDSLPYDFCIVPCD